ITTATANITITNPNGLTISNAGVCYSNSNNLPTISNSTQAINSGALAGNYNLALSGLTASTTYYVRGYVNFNGIYYYGTVQSFTTITIPTVSTNPLTNITAITATANITITNPNGLTIPNAGVCYSSSNNLPTISNSTQAINSGALTGNYTITISDLNATTTYYLRGYINYNGTIYYGAVQSFTTINLPTTLTLSNLEENMVTVPAGSFTMGATNEQQISLSYYYNNWDGQRVSEIRSYSFDAARANIFSPLTQHVILSSYKICRFEVTQQLWIDVMGSNPSINNGGSYGINLQRPVENVSWDNIQTFINKLNQLTGKNYILPTEAEWEYAARGGANSTYRYLYSGSDSINDVAIENGGYNTAHVGTKQANALGLYDMTGNVTELCNDWFNIFNSTSQTNPKGPVTGSDKVIRGKSTCFDNLWGCDYRLCIRDRTSPSLKTINVGFRLVSH
ncbi:MAG: formylglycine-generating enzyme family protein, partial [Sediminibacterium sp.]|nr:formylglycine-generating enzyme family protein [Sediminibacterium sp.]